MIEKQHTMTAYHSKLSSPIQLLIGLFVLLFWSSSLPAQRNGNRGLLDTTASKTAEKTELVSDKHFDNPAHEQYGCSSQALPKEYQHHESPSDIEDYLRFVRNNERTLGTRNAACVEIPVNIVVIRRNNESADLDALFHSTMTRINQMCQSSNISIRFKLTRIHKISEADFSTFNQEDKYGELRNRYTDYPRVLPLLITHYDGGGGFAAVGWMAVLDRFASPENWLHEMGHFLGLHHTHDGGQELVNGSNCTTAGDYVCDTPAEPGNHNGQIEYGIIAHVDVNCQYTGTFRDANGELYRPDPYNIMGYSGCKSRLTKGQETRMLYFLRTKYPQIVTSTNCDGSNVPTIASFSDTKCYRFNNRHSGRVMEVGGNNTENGGIVQQWGWLGSKSQVWRVKDVGNGFNQIVNGNSGRVLNVADAGTGDGTPINQWEWSSGNNQKWKLTPNAEGYYTITAQHSGKTLDVYTAATNDGAKILHWAVNNQANQQWQIAEATCPAGTVTAAVVAPIASFSDTKCYRFNNRNSGKVMEVGGNSTENGGIVQQWGWIGSKSQVWRVKDVGSGFNQIVNGNSGRVLNVADAGTGDGTPINQWEWVNGNHQKWKLAPNAEGYYTITAQHSGKTLDVYAFGTNDGAKILHWAVNSQANQQWQIAEATCPAGTATVTDGGSSSTLECEANVNNGGWQILGSCAVTIPAGQRLELAVNPNGLSSYQWSGPNGFSRAGDANGNILIADAITSSQAGNYTVTVNNNGTTSTKTINVTVTGGGGGGGGSLAFECEANVNNGGWQNLGGNCAVTIPAGQRLELSANPNGASSYQWTGPNGFSGTGNSDGNILVSDAVTSSQAGTYTVTFNSNGVLASLPIYVTVTGGGTGGGTCTLRFTNTGCQPASLVFNDINGIGLVGYGSIPANSTKEIPHQSDYAVPGAYVMKVGSTTVGSYSANCNNPNYSFNTGGCDPCAASPVTATVSGNRTICAGQTTVLTASGGTIYKWSNGATTAAITVGTGAYTVTATNATGCTATKTVTVTTATATVAGKLSICAGQTTTLTASGGTTYKWSNGATTAAITVGTGAYTVTATNATGCTATKTVTVTTSPASVGGSVASQSPILSNNTIPAGFFTLTGHTGTIQKWEWSMNGTTWNNWGGANLTNSPILTLSSGATQVHVRVLVKNNTCTAVYSTIKIVTIGNINTLFSATKCYTFTSKLTGMNMEVQNSSALNNAVIVQNRPNATASFQIWRIQPLAEAPQYAQVTNVSTRLSLSIRGNSLDNGISIVQNNWYNHDAQKWGFVSTIAQHYQLLNKATSDSKALGGINQRAGSTLTSQISAPSNNNQQWKISEVTCPLNARTEKDIQSEGAIKVYPNPNTGIFYIALRDEFAANDELLDVNIYSALGQVIHQQQVNNIANSPILLDLQGLPIGIYMVQVQNTKGISVTKPLVITE